MPLFTLKFNMSKPELNCVLVAPPNIALCLREKHGFDLNEVIDYAETLP